VAPHAPLVLHLPLLGEQHAIDEGNKAADRFMLLHLPRRCLYSPAAHHSLPVGLAEAQQVAQLQLAGGAALGLDCERHVAAAAPLDAGTLPLRCRPPCAPPWSVVWWSFAFSVATIGPGGSSHPPIPDPRVAAADARHEAQVALLLRRWRVEQRWRRGRRGATRRSGEGGQ